jgi:orotate phosphoribosyltransferase
MIGHQLPERNLDILVRNGGFRFTDTFFPFTSGQIGPYFVQSGVVQNKGEDFVKAVSDMWLMVKSVEDIGRRRFDVISGGESRDWIFSMPVAVLMQKPHDMIYKDGKVVGADMAGKNVAHISDLNNEGSSPRDLWVPAIVNARGRISDIFFYVDRMEDGTRVMKELGLESHAVVPLDEHAWDYLVGHEVISSAVYRSLRARMEDKGAWARAMLKSDAGFQTFAKLYGDSGTRAKAEKIMTIGYPDMERELRERLAG